jgi:hypothetical protein
MAAEDVTLDHRFTINYTGKVYRKGMDPGPFFDALRSMLASGTLDGQRTEVNFYGDGHPWFLPMIKERGLDDLVKVHSSVPRKESLDIQKRSQMLLILGWDNKKEKGVYTGKVFDYLAAKRPILSVGSSDDVIGELLRRTGTGLIATTPEEIVQHIESAFREFLSRGEVPYHGNLDEVMRYSHRAMAQQFAGLLRG